MIHLKKILTYSFSAILTSLSCQLAAFDVCVSAAEGEEYILEFPPEESLQSVVQAVRGCMADNLLEEGRIQMDFAVDQDSVIINAYVIPKAPPRNYYAPVTAQEKKDLSFILRTLANNSLAKIAKDKSNLKKAGDRIDNLHPFKFIETVFTDEELKVCIRAVEGRSWVWDEFRDGITKSLAKESAVDNIKPEYVQNLADLLKIDVNLIAPTIQERNWSKLVTDLIAIVPRSGGSDRYNM